MLSVLDDGSREICPLPAVMPKADKKLPVFAQIESAVEATHCVECGEPDQRAGLDVVLTTQGLGIESLRAEDGVLFTEILQLAVSEACRRLFSFQSRLQDFERVGVEQIIGVEEKYVFAARILGCVVTGGRYPLVLLSEDCDRIALRDFQAVIRRAVIDEDDLDVG